jgi:putative membrane protein insertion efficiency factor
VVKNWIKALLYFLRGVLHSTTGVENTCQFQPTCSQYGAQAVERHGVFLGLWLLIKRLLKCHPWGKGGLDLVPEKRPLWRS